MTDHARTATTEGSDSTAMKRRAADENLAERLWDADLTVNRILHLPSMLCTERLPDVIKGDDWGADPTDALKALLGGYTEDESEMWWEEVWWLYRRLYQDGGQPPRWMVQVERPVPFNVRFDDDGEPRSWSTGGSYAVEWVTGVTYDDCMTAAAEWSERVRTEAIEKARHSETATRKRPTEPEQSGRRAES